MDARTLVAKLAEERPRFVRVARRLVPTAADAEDVVQRAMMRAAERAGSLGDPARLGPWFTTIVRRTAADLHRSSREKLTESGELDPQAEGEVPHGNMCQCTLRILDDLRPAYALVLRMVDVEGRDPEEVTAALGITAGNLHVRLHRARRALLQRVQDHCGVTRSRPCFECTCAAGRRCHEIQVAVPGQTSP
jgi:RNA polymerase sigma-70 factor (ECF subfamily)